ncbi:MAG: hypothetical protein WA991_10675 [Ornithinimicrobium sp.]
MSYNSLGLFLGIAGGPLLGEVLIGWGGFTFAWLGAAALNAIAAIIVVFIAEPARPRVRTIRSR